MIGLQIQIQWMFLAGTIIYELWSFHCHVWLLGSNPKLTVHSWNLQSAVRCSKHTWFLWYRMARFDGNAGHFMTGTPHLVFTYKLSTDVFRMIRWHEAQTSAGVVNRRDGYPEHDSRNFCHYPNISDDLNLVQCILLACKPAIWYWKWPWTELICPLIAWWFSRSMFTYQRDPQCRSSDIISYHSP